MDVPEIRAMVALHLCRLFHPKETRQDLAVCARVCKDWQATFMPLLYRSVDLTIQSTDTSHYETPAPSSELLQANHHLVQELSLTIFSTDSPVLQQTTAAFQNLTKLRLLAHTERRDGGPTGIHWLDLRHLLVNNRRIQELSLGYITDFGGQSYRCLSDIAEDCTSHLTTLRLFGMNVGWFQLLSVVTNCRQLTMLQCDTCRFLGSRQQFMEVTAVSSPVATNITNLELLATSGVPLVEWMKMCPRLATLSVADTNRTSLGPVSQFSAGPQLSSLKLDSYYLEDAELAEVLAGCTSLKRVTLEETLLTGQVFAGLSRHFDSLVYLNLRRMPISAQWAIRRIFEGCPRLEELSVTNLDVNSLYNDTSDNQEDLPWACRDTLKDLWIVKIKMSLDSSSNDRFMKRLMDLKQLEDLVIEAIFRLDETESISTPKNEPRDTPEALLLGKLCECKNWELSLKDEKQDPRWTLVRGTWPKLLNFYCKREPYEGYE